MSTLSTNIPRISNEYELVAFIFVLIMAIIKYLASNKRLNRNAQNKINVLFYFSVIAATALLASEILHSGGGEQDPKNKENPAFPINGSENKNVTTNAENNAIVLVETNKSGGINMSDIHNSPMILNSQNSTISISK